MAILVARRPFILNGVTQLTKVLASLSSAPAKRAVLAIFSIVGVLCMNALYGSPLDASTIPGLIQVLLTSCTAFLAAHGSYHFFAGLASNPNATGSS